MTRSLKLTVFFVSTVAEAVGVKGTCSVASGDRWAVEQDIFRFYIYLSLFPFHKKGKLGHSLATVVHSPRGSRSSFHVSARRAIASNSAASKTVTSPRATYGKKCHFPRHHHCPELLLRHHFHGQLGHCGLDKRLRILQCLHHSNNRNLQRK